MRYPESATAKRHKEVHGGCAYDDFIDQWSAKDFDAGKMAKLFRRAGAKYIVPVSKHHDGVTLWDAPGTNGRNTVHRGPKRDLIKEWADACDQEDLKFGVYYST
jgi:alpha-L-fucosidase